MPPRQVSCAIRHRRVDQRDVMQQMLEKGIATRRGIMCTHREQAYRDYPPRRPLARSEHAQDHCILLPLYHQMTDADQELVISALREACAITESEAIDATVPKA